MSKYGFNENEVRKTIITKIDKDGFHKEEIFDGNVDGGSSDFTFATMTVANDSEIFAMAAPTLLEAEDENPACIGVDDEMRPFHSGDVEKLLLYKGAAVYKIDSGISEAEIDGDAEIDLNTRWLTIYGDFTIKVLRSEF